MMNKRVPNNHNLTLWMEPQYQGLKINRNHELVTEYLHKLLRVINSATTEHPRTLAVLVELHCEVPTPELANSNQVMQDFKAALDSRMTSYMTRREARGQRVYPCKVRWVWAREQKDSHVPHFHVMLLFNRDTFSSLGDYHSDRGSLMSMISNAWYSALGIPPELKRGLIHAPKNAVYHLQPSKQYAELSDLFEHASYMCKVTTKTFGRGVQCFGGSRR